MDSLRTELIEAQKERTEFIRWKLVLVAAISTVGLGLNGTKLVPESKLVMCCIPFVCAYVDTMCSHLSLRVQVIGIFLKGRNIDGDIYSAYEIFVHKAREMDIPSFSFKISAFALQRYLIPLSSILINIFIMIYGHFANSALIYWSAVIGILSVVFVEISYTIRQTAINKIPK